MVIMEASANLVKKWVTIVNFVVVVEDVKEVEPEKEMETVNVTRVFPVKPVINVLKVFSKIPAAVGNLKN